MARNKHLVALNDRLVINLDFQSPQALQLLNQLIPLIQNRALKITEILGSPIRILLNSVGYTAWKRNIQHIRPRMTVITIDLLAVAFRGERYADFAYERLAIVAICIAPYAVNLCKSTLVVDAEMKMRHMLTSSSPHMTAITLKGLMPWLSG